MSDLIDRRAAIDAIANCTNCGDEKTLRAYVAKHNLDNGWTGGVLQALDAVKDFPSAQPEQRWIPCSERLPDEKDAVILKKLGIEKISEDVLATVEVKGERMTVTACTYDGKWEWNMKYAFPDYKVIAWMPLPEPYREEGEKHEGSD